MKIRTCDKCKKEIKTHEKYLKIVEQFWEGKAITQNHIGDLCVECWEQWKK
jgi:hypothetical protein